ncbi:S9 family peptidase [Streptomyces sp. ISL-98]|uniref:prolyl oligopeptidase family serine peptidase n=1 Tax=Streptomyces sp. ISL-98 TaxID=2819192 RepID=UPI001BEBCCC9|nr:prolyl oligopeptidase family serine peptidase [Streptomyces sp. ISL-98]MBT2505792.1 S9 family peptidase [Streptomyces sp. ISL-98]
MDVEEFPRQFARTRRFSLGVPRRFTVSPDGERVLFVRSDSGSDPVSRLWLYEDGSERIIAGPHGGDGNDPEAERIRRERARETSTGVVAYATDLPVRVVAYALGGELWVVRTDGGTPRRIPTAGPAVDPRPSPDGRLVAYVTGGALRVVSTDGRGDDRLLAEPEGGEVTYGLPDHVAAESLDRTRGHWWSPDSDALLVARVDTSMVQRWYLSDPANPAQVPRSVPYPAAGTANAETSLHIVRLDGDAVAVRIPDAADPEYHFEGRWTDTAFEYVVSAGWDAIGPVVNVQTRDQRTACLLDIDPATGATSPLHTQRDPAWLEFVPGAPTRTASGAPVIPFVPQEGRARGLRMVRDKAVTPPGLNVREVLCTIGERVLFTANEEPTEVHVWSYEPASGFVRLTTEPGIHTAAAGGSTVVLDSRTPDGHTVTVLRDGRPAGHIAVLAEEPLITPRPIHLSLGERALRSRLFLPSWYEPGAGKLPVLLSPYAGPGVQLVVKARMWWTAVAQWWAEQGFAVLMTDGRGTPGRGIAWEKSIHGDQLTPVLEDQIDALHAAAGHCDALDLERVGIRGWSFGGYLAAGAVLHRPEVFHAAVAGAAPTDMRLYDTHWKERYLGHPDVMPENYERCSLVGHAGKLTRPLMLVHGMADDNVAPAHMLRFSAALLAAGRPHTVLPLPGASHLVTQEGVADSLLLLELDFLKKSLGA